jgi:hypothetical protein
MVINYLVVEIQHFKFPPYDHQYTEETVHYKMFNAVGLMFQAK